MILQIAILAIGLVLLIKGADMLIESACRLACMAGISQFIVGLTIVAFGTSAPETAVGIFSALDGTNLVSLGDVVGSDIANILLILGITALIRPTLVEHSILTKDVPFSFVVQIFLAGIVLAFSGIPFWGGIALLGGFVLFLYYVYRRAREGIIEVEHAVAEVVDDAIHHKKPEEYTEHERRSHVIFKAIVVLLLSLAAIVFGANLVVTSAETIAKMIGVSEVIIGLTMVAVGTSLPELVTCVIAALKNDSDLAVGNIIGSNIYNILLVLGISATIHPIVTDTSMVVDLLFMLGATLLLFFLCLRRGIISRFYGLILLAAYGIFLYFEVAVH
jgi:cation:H+ antiporter